MTESRKVAAIIAGVALIVAAWVFRYDTQPIAGSNGFYVLTNRITGSVQFCAGRTCQSVSHMQ